MTQNYRLLLLAACLIISGISFTESCMCLPLGTVQSEAAQTDLIFGGRVIQITQDEEFNVLVNFCVDDVWKGDKISFVRISTCSNPICCGFEFQYGQDYLVYAMLKDGRYDVSICSRTKLRSEANEDIEEIEALPFEHHEVNACSI